MRVFLIIQLFKSPEVVKTACLHIVLVNFSYKMRGLFEHILIQCSSDFPQFERFVSQLKINGLMAFFMNPYDSINL